MVDVDLQQVGPYTNIRLLKEGPTGRTYLGKHQQRKKYVIIKMYRTPLTSTEAKEAFIAHAKQLKKLKHRNIAEILDFGLIPDSVTHQDYAYLVTQYVLGETILQRLPAGQCNKPDEVKRVLSPLADALHYAHVMNIVHGNLHPDNVFTGENKDIMLTGFSVMLREISPSHDTQAAAFLYKSPEHLREGVPQGAHKGSPLQAASDQYSLAVMVYEWLCGHRPYEATEPGRLLYQQEHEPLPAPRSLNSDISPTIEGVLLRALSPNAGERFPHTLTFADAYLRALMGFPMVEDRETKYVETARSTQFIAPVSPTYKIDRSNNNDDSTSEDTLKTGMINPAPIEREKVNIGAQFIAPITPAPLDTLEPTNEKVIDLDSIKRVLTSNPIKSDTAPPAVPTLHNGNSDLHDIVAADLGHGGILSASLPGYEERMAQVEMATMVARSLTEDIPAIVEAGTGTGKALDVDTPIPTPTGWKRMGDLVPGDFVFDEKGHPTRVMTAFDVMYHRTCYEVVFSDGSSIVADAEHEWASYTNTDRIWAKRPRTSTYAGKNFITSDQLTGLDQLIVSSPNDSALSVDEAVKLLGGHHWSVYQAAVKMASANSDKRPKRYPQQTLLTAVRNRLARDLSEQHRNGQPYTLVTTEEVAATLTVGSPARANHALPVAEPLVLPDADLLIAPYFLGIWLGDGSCRTNHITTADPALIIEIEKDGYTVRSLQSHPYLYAVDDENGKAVSRWQPGMTGRLRTLGVLLKKHIPEIYLRASEQQRRALLAGLLDTDGTVSRCGAVEFTSTNPQLAQDVYELVCSLGFRPTLRCGRSRYKGKDCGPKWTLAFTTNEQVFRLERKVADHKERLRNYSPERNRFRYVVGVREVPSRPVRCIQVESQSHLYLAGRSMIPTHNSLAYLIPIVRSGKVAIISTANKALQEQLFYKDIPFVQKHIKNFEAALVKGMGNYVCLDRLDSEHHGIQHYVKNRDFMRLVEITEDPASTFMGDFETLDFPLPGDIRSKINADRDQCAWSKCNYFSECYVRKMKVKAEHSQVIVVNHTLLLLDAAMEGLLLPDRDVIILDEAHHLEEEATRAFTVTISQAKVSTLLAQRMLKDHSSISLQEEAKQTMVTVWERLFQVADPDYKGRASLPGPLEEGLALATVISKLGDSLRQQRPKDLPEKESQLYDKLVSRAKNLAENTRMVFSVNQSDKFVYYVERVNASGRRGGQLEVSAAPLDVTKWLKEQLFNKCNVICTSATLATIGPNPANPTDRGPNFAYFRRRVGLDYAEYPNVQERILPLTFDYESHALLYIPRHLPEPAYGTGPAAIEYMKALAREMVGLVEASRGRAFLLFSSKRMLEEVYEEFNRLLPSHLDFALLRQGDMNRIELLRQFREQEGAVLFGLKSFWEGVDIVGEALSLVVIDKLPFDPPDDPVHEARVAQMKTAGENWFGIYVLPQAVLRLKQGLGRLLRTREDRGVMAILDTRLYTKGYGRMVINALPPARRTDRLQEVERFFSQEQAPF